MHHLKWSRLRLFALIQRQKFIEKIKNNVYDA